MNVCKVRDGLGMMDIYEVRSEYKPETDSRRARGGNEWMHDYYRGLSTAKRYEWLIDCYRLRVSDDARWGHYVHGLYAAVARGPGTYTRVNVILPDLLVFCKLAVRAKVGT
jgi:hypothetical protein